MSNSVGRRLMPAAMLVLALAAAPVRSQSLELLVSLSKDDALPTELVRDQDLLWHAPGEMARVAWPSETLALLTGDDDGALPLHHVFTDIDAVHDHGAFGGPWSTAADGLYVSFTSNEAGFVDGDIVRMGPGAPSVAFAEWQFIAAAGAVDDNIDVDAFQLDPDGTVLFSFAENEDSATLSGDDPGVIKDGAILRWGVGDPTATILYTESEVEAMVEQALSATASITDTFGVARDPVTGAVLFCVQSPSSDDASVFSDEGGGVRLTGHAEADFGFTGVPEMDALSVAKTPFTTLTTSSPTPQAGETVGLAVRGGHVGWAYFVLASTGHATPSIVMPGWGAFALEQDPLLALSWSTAITMVMVTDIFGVAMLDADMPAAVAPTDIVIQAFGPGLGPDASNPVLLELAQ